MKHNIKRVKEEKTNTRIFTWFGYPRLRPRLQAHPLEDFTIQAFPRLQTITIDFKVSMNLYNKRLYLQSLHPKCLSHLYSHNLMRNDKYNNESLFKSGYTNYSSMMIQQMMIYEMEAQYMLCALVYACLSYQK